MEIGSAVGGYANVQSANLATTRNAQESELPAHQQSAAEESRESASVQRAESNTSAQSVAAPAANDDTNRAPADPVAAQAAGRDKGLYVDVNA